MFNLEFREKTNDYVMGNITLDQYKAWLMPMTFLYLQLPDEHPANDIKHLLAEYSYEDSGITEAQLKDGMTRIMNPREEASEQKNKR